MSTRPPGWNKTLADLQKEADEKGGAIHFGDEWTWAREYERSLLRPWARFPKDGDVYESLMDVDVRYTIQWYAPFTSGGSGRLRRGEWIRAKVWEIDLEPVYAAAYPVDSDRVERDLVPEAVRKAEKYSGITLMIHVADLNRQWKLIER